MSTKENPFPNAKLAFTNPFAPVEVQPVNVAGSNDPNRIAVRVQADDGNWGVQGILGRDYYLMPNRKVRDLAEDVMSRAPAELGGFRNLKTLYDGKKYVDYFASNSPIANLNGKRSPLELSLGIMVWNCYDGTRKTGFEIFALNPFCTNQYHSRNRFGFFAWRHTPGEMGKIDAQDVLQNIGIGVQNIIQIAPVIHQMKDQPLTVLAIKDAKRKTDLPTSKWGEVLDGLKTEEDNLFGLFQAMTNVASHKLTGMSSISTGTSITEHFLALSGSEAIDHTTASQFAAIGA